MAAVMKWSGREARALRLARRMSVRDFAAHLGVNDAAVSSWERRGDKARLRYQTQQILDTDLERAPDDVKQRFEIALTDQDAPADGTVRTQRQLGAGSADRTRTIIAAIHAGDESRLTYLPPAGASDRVRDFLASPSRVYVVAGGAGYGKSRLTLHLAEEIADEADFQLHAVDSWEANRPELATEILRYASIPGGGDPLLTLEGEGVSLRRPCVVIIDGLKTRDELNIVGRQVDMVLRQVTQDKLRFLLVVRTPPSIDLAAFPVLAACIFHGAPGSSRSSDPSEGVGASFRLSSWTLAEAQNVWDLTRGEDGPAFTALPPQVRQLVRMPLYMHLLSSAGRSSLPGEANPYQLVRLCVRTLLHSHTQEVDRAVHDLGRLAHRELPDLIPAQLDALHTDNPPSGGEPITDVVAVPSLVRIASGVAEFEHDVIREYFLATYLAGLLAARGRGAATASAINGLAEAADRSGIADKVFEFVIYDIDASAPDLLAAVALSPMVGTRTALPRMVELAAAGSVRFATDEVLCACARRCLDDCSLELARSLLETPAVAQALGPDYPGWLLGVLRMFGTAVWAETVGAIEASLDAEVARAIFAAAGGEPAEVATFFGRHFRLFVGVAHELGEPLDALLGHPDWRVRAAFADGLHDGKAPRDRLSNLIIQRLVRDEDYKVRAAAAHATGRLPADLADRHVRVLLADENWHVRERLLRGLMLDATGSPPTSILSDTIVAAMHSDDSWHGAPPHVEALKQRLMALHDAPRRPDSAVGSRALFGILREVRTGWLPVPKDVQDSLVAAGRDTHSWLVRREADMLSSESTSGSERGSVLDLLPRREAFRRLRDRRAVQVALDTHDIDHALTVAGAAAAAGFTFVEVGDPLIKEMGIGAVEQVKRHVPDMVVVAEMMSADWGRDQVVLAAEAGADVVLLIGPATVASVAAAVEAGRRLGVPIVLDVPVTNASRLWIRDMERAGVDGFAITTNIDLGVGGRPPLVNARIIREWTWLPVAVSGGFSATDRSVLHSADWDILIVGRSITEAVQPEVAASRLATLLAQMDSKERE